MADVTILATGLGFPEGPVVCADGSVVLTEIRNQRCSRVTPDGKVSVFSNCGGGPNGLAIGPDGYFYLCNNGGSRYVDGGWLSHDTEQDELKGPSVLGKTQCVVDDTARPFGTVDDSKHPQRSAIRVCGSLNRCALGLGCGHVAHPGRSWKAATATSVGSVAAAASLDGAVRSLHRLEQSRRRMSVGRKQFLSQPRCRVTVCST